MTTLRIALTALVNEDGAVLLRMVDEQSTVRANRWSLPGGAVRTGETPARAAVRLVEEQTGLSLTDEPRLYWHGFLPGTRVDVYLFAAPTSARVADVRAQDYITNEFVPGAEVLSGRSFTTAAGFKLGDFLSSAVYDELTGRVYPSGLA